MKYAVVCLEIRKSIHVRMSCHTILCDNDVRVGLVVIFLSYFDTKVRYVNRALNMDLQQIRIIGYDAIGKYVHE